jgi:hypothetical protein
MEQITWKDFEKVELRAGTSAYDWFLPADRQGRFAAS